MPNSPQLRVVTTVPYDYLVENFRDAIVAAAIEGSHITIKEPTDGETMHTKLSKGKNGVKVVITID